MKTKIDRLRESWVHVLKRAPDLKSEYTQVEVWHPERKASMIWEIATAYRTINGLRNIPEDGEEYFIAADRLISHWRYVVPPC